MPRPPVDDAIVATGTSGAPPTLQDVARENELLREQLASITQQAGELRRECRAIEDRLASQARFPSSRETFSLPDFLPGSDGQWPPLLPEAIKFYETHDGCPFLDAGRCDGEPVPCNGAWIRMGHPCWRLVARVKDIAGALPRQGVARPRPWPPGTSSSMKPASEPLSRHEHAISRYNQLTLHQHQVTDILNVAPGILVA